MVIFAGMDSDQNGTDTMGGMGGDDSDSLGNSKGNITKGNITPAKEKRKPFFKKVRTWITWCRNANDYTRVNTSCNCVFFNKIYFFNVFVCLQIFLHVLYSITKLY